MGCATGTVKVLVFIFNFACAIVGLALLIVASVSLVSLNSVDSVSNGNHTLVPGLLIGIGAAIFLISFLGCCGVCQKSQCMLITYAAVLLLLFVLQLGLGIYGYTQLPSDDSEIKEKFIKDLEATFTNFPTDEVVKAEINAFQSGFQCCGIRGFADYGKLNGNVRIPGTCCDKPESDSCPTPPKYPDGCGDKLYDAVKSFLGIVVYVNLGICITEIVGAFFAVCLVNSYRNDDRRNY